MPSAVTRNQTGPYTPTLREASEAISFVAKLPKYQNIPMALLVDDKSRRPITAEIIEEARRACLVTLQVLRIGVRHLINLPKIAEMFDLSPDAKGLRSYKRLENTSPAIPLVVLSTAPIYDSKGRVCLGVSDEDGKIMLNIPEIVDEFADAIK